MCVVQLSPCLIPTATIESASKGQVSITFGGPSRVLRCLADASVSANQWDLEIETASVALHMHLAVASSKEVLSHGIMTVNHIFSKITL
jgi:hypothetical protein